MQINKFPSQEEAIAGAGEALNKLLAENKSSPILLLLSAGSALAILDFINASSLGENLTITMLDERFSQEPEANNFLQLQKLDFYTLALNANANFIGTLPRLNENMNDMQTRLEIGLTNWLNQHPQGKVFATLGMGPDGHTAGIFPSSDVKFFETAFENSHLITAYRADTTHKYKDRVTATFNLFKYIDEAIVFICGPEKQAKFKELLAGQAQINHLPIAGVVKTKHYQIFTNIQ
jgi:6-phosphogluconolactonase/glucosamine-6-phosphate isomerase/deaminase